MRVRERLIALREDALARAVALRREGKVAESKLWRLLAAYCTELLEAGLC